MVGRITDSLAVALIAAIIMFIFGYFETYIHFEKSDKRKMISLQNGISLAAAALTIVFIAAYTLLTISGV